MERSAVERPSVSRFAVSTLGAPGRPLEEVLDAAREAGAGALELRAGPGQPADPELTAAELDLRRARIEEHGLDVLAVASYVRVAAEGDDGPVVDDLADHLRLAARLGAPYLRVFPGGPGARPERTRVPDPDPGAEERAARRLTAVVPLAEELGVAPALETHDSHPRGEDVVRVLDLLDDRARAATAVVWDLLHPWRVGEPIERTWGHLSPWLTAGRGWVQFKDVAAPEDPFPLPPGQGALPLDAALALLHDAGYTGPLSLEWEKAWHPGAADLEVALEHSRRLFDPAR
ncbi:sugar phosphate isomerase/epimerase [Nocardiopsis sp. MG754419]|uniref:sugar phosphate isomerase/epimerase family protein n=1 Tax=Nocardiopsis sp. MG754419 TaxID=2259865 RepID=UPI001BA7F3E1|nr:sugar phosphate isomerase/epimerase family protein [Nocardiopsis sp. MG754419]MBR8742946.1 sugar phosphate isomerase/epimerase [Nocardiopsis sp. MG754419]